MAQQISLVNFIGKIGNNSFFYSRRGGFQSRQPAVGMGARVLKEPEFENTRRNASEFMTSAKIASLMTQVISDSFPNFLTGNVRQDLTKVIRKLSEQETTKNWGYRIVPYDKMYLVQEELSKHSHSKVPEWLKNHLEYDCVYNLTNGTITDRTGLDMPRDYQEYLESSGADAIKIETNVLGLLGQQYLQYSEIGENEFYKLYSLNNEQEILDLYSYLPIKLFHKGIFEVTPVYSNMFGIYFGFIYSILPIRRVNGFEYPMWKYSFLYYKSLPLDGEGVQRRAKQKLDDWLSKYINLK